MIGIIVQARMSSTRLPGKVMKKLGDKPMLQVQLERLKQTRLCQQLLVATSENPEDDAIATLCTNINVKCYRGDLNDVLARFYHCAKRFHLSNIVRICGDSPLIDPVLIDDVVQHHLSVQADYTSNCIKRHFPDGQDIEVFTFAALENAFNKAQKPSEREHVTPFIRDCGLYTLADYEIAEDYSQFRTSVDHPEDFEVITAIYNALHKQPFGYKEIAQFLLSHPQVNAINADIELNEGYKLSLLQDKQQGY